MSREAAPLFLVFEGAALDHLLFRIVERCPPTLDDFRSYEALGRAYDRRDFFKGIGVSMHVSHRRAVWIARRFGHGRGVAALELRAVPGRVDPTERRGSRSPEVIRCPALESALRRCASRPAGSVVAAVRLPSLQDVCERVARSRKS